MNITVYLGAGAGNDPAFAPAVEALGRWIGKSGHALVYGGSKSGLMGVLAKSALAAGAAVTGVEPQFFIDRSYQCEGLTRLIVTKDMAERRAKMIELGDVFIAFPGGTGTLEEVSEVMCQVSLGMIDGPCIFYNLGGYWEPVRLQLARMREKGLSDEDRQRNIHFAADLASIQAILAADFRRRSGYQGDF